MSVISEIVSREIFDSRGLPTVEVDVITSDGSLGRYAVPSGSSTGKAEALELRNKNGNGVSNALDNISKYIAPNLIGLDCSDQKKIDFILLQLDGTNNKSNLGANSMLGVSMACAVAASNSLSLCLYSYIAQISNNKNTLRMPIPMMNFINGGSHASNKLAIQEFMITPMDVYSQDTIAMCSEIYHKLKEILSCNGFGTSVGDEGGFVPIGIDKTSDALDLLMEAIDGYRVGIALDSAASSFYFDGSYHIDSQCLDSSGMIDFYSDLISKYPIVSIEDGLEEQDYNGWKSLTKQLGESIMIVGDDLFVTNKELIKFGIKNQIANCVLIKPNQIGTLTETLEAIKLAHDNDYNTIISHRSGDTEDVSIVHLGFGASCHKIKTGAICRSERVAKYNEMIRVHERL